MAQIKPFSLDDLVGQADAPHRTRWSERHPWLNLFTSVTASILVAGVLLGMGLRWYIVWTLTNTLEQAKQGRTK